MQKNFLSRTRKFTPKIFFLSVLHLASSTNNEGYFTALHRTWSKQGLSLKYTPSKSSLSEYREKVSSNFFRDVFNKDLKRTESTRKKFRGFYIYAIDGDHLDVPVSKNVLDSGYRGFPFSAKQETYYPKMYTAQAVDLVNGLIRKFEYSNKISEILMARKIAADLEKNSITLYDRLYDCYATALVHHKAQNHFFVRVKTGNLRSPLEVQKFKNSHQKSKWINLSPPQSKRRLKSLPVLKVRLIKVKNSRSKEPIMFMTNLPEGVIKNKEAAQFYARRWGIESSFKDLTDTLKMCQWHSKTLNGVLQEIYALLWLVNQVKRVCNQVTDDTKKWFENRYKKPNFKLIANIFIDHLALLLKHRYRKFHKIITYWITRSTETRVHLSRSYPRQVKLRGKNYFNASCIGRRNAA